MCLIGHIGPVCAEFSGPGGGEVSLEDGAGGIQATGETVFVKAVFEPSSGIIGDLVRGNGV